MKLVVTRRAALPRLAWAATFERGDAAVRVDAGPAVEARDAALVEGAWPGRFREMEFPSAATFTGTGLSIDPRDGSAILCTPTHSLAPIYVLARPRSLLASNSLPFLLARAGDRLSPRYPHYDADVMSIALGLSSYRREIPTAAGARVGLHYVCNLRIDDALRVRVLPKAGAPRFASYASYRDFLASTVAEVVANAGDAGREIRYEPLATISSGYDSPACAVLAREAGATRAVTLLEAREDFDDRSDSGAEVARTLGLACAAIEPESYAPRDRPGFEAEFLASGYGGDDIVWAGAEDRLRGTLLVTGYHGDKIWDTSAESVSEDLKRGDPSGGSLLEFRLRVGFLNLPVPMIGCLRHPDVHAISNAPEMARWRLGTDYDRPIPRRIVESAGVARHAFARRKLAVARPCQSMDGENSPLAAVLSADALADFRRFRAASGRAADTLDGAGARALRRLVRSYKARALASRLGLQGVFGRLRLRYQKPVDEHNFVTAWAAERLGERYR